MSLPFVSSVLHPSDFSPASENAFAHALAIALYRQTRLTILHVGREEGSSVPWTRFPGVRETLERWGFLEPGSPRSAVFEELKVRVRKIAVRSRHPTLAMLRFLDEQPTDLMVLATGGRDGVPRWVQRSVAEPVARRSQTMTLFVPDGAEGFVSPDNGEINIRNVLVPIDRDPGPEAAIELATRAAGASASGPVKLTLLHIGEQAPALQLPEDPAWAWSRMQRQGPVVSEILKAADELAADLTIMVTAGREGVLDALRGTTTEQVLRQSPCPVLAVPAHLG